MTNPNRRAFIGGLAVAAGTLATARAQAAGSDGQAAGYDVAYSAEHVPLIPRRTGDPVAFTASLDKSADQGDLGWLGSRYHHQRFANSHRYCRRASLPQSWWRARDALAQFSRVGLHFSWPLPSDRRRSRRRNRGRQLCTWGSLVFSQGPRPRDPGAWHRTLPRNTCL